LELQVDEAISNSYGYEVLFNNIWYTFEEIFAENNIKNRDEDIIIFIQQLEEYLKINYTEPITSQTLCEKFGYVPTYLSKLFKKYKNVSPTEYLIDLRVEKAKELLRSKPDMLSKDIAYLLGFSDSHYFSKVFKNKTGMRPSDFRDS
jgi:two-component system response regulator YesN